MPRHSREQSGTGIYHVMLRGVNRQSIFEDDEDYIRFISLLRNLVQRFDDTGRPLPALCTIYAYCLMDNHIHLLVKEQTESISTAVKRVAVSYAYYFNRKYSSGSENRPLTHTDPQEKNCSKILSSVKVFVSLQTKYYLYGKDN